MYVLSYLVAQGYDVKVITEDKNVERLAIQYDLQLRQLDTMGEFDLFICCHGRKIIPKKILVEGKFINIHPCLYKYMGHNPIKRYIKNKDRLGTVESQWLIEKIDGGEVIHQEKFDTGEVKNYAEFYNIAVPYYFWCIDETLKKLYDNT